MVGYGCELLEHPLTSVAWYLIVPNVLDSWSDKNVWHPLGLHQRRYKNSPHFLFYFSKVIRSSSQVFISSLLLFFYCFKLIGGIFCKKITPLPIKIFTKLYKIFRIFCHDLICLKLHISFSF